MRLPEPMLAKPGQLPTDAGWSFEPKWDGFRAIVRSGDHYCVRSRRGWLMTELLPEFGSLPIEGVFDGELVAFGGDGLPSFDRLSRRILHGDTSIPIALVVFDVLKVEGLPTMAQPYSERRKILELLAFGSGCHVSPRFDDGAALWASVCERGLEGVVAKRDRAPGSERVTARSFAGLPTSMSTTTLSGSVRTATPASSETARPGGFA